MRFVLLVGLGITTPTIASARQVTVAIEGTVTDSSGAPVGGASVELNASVRRAVSDEMGRFRFPAAIAGTYIVSVSADGFAPRHARFTVPPNQRRAFDSGRWVLRALTSDLRVVALEGTITDEITDRPLSQVFVGINGEVVAVTDGAGRFRASAAFYRNTENTIRLQRIGYLPVERSFPLPNVPFLDFGISLQPDPVTLEDITVEAEAPSADALRLADAGFYRRRRASFGEFFTAEAIARMRARSITDVLRRVPGASVWSLEDAAVTAVGGPGEASVRFAQRSGYLGGMMCTGPTLFVDGAQVPIENIDRVRDADRLAGIEVYSSDEATPPEFLAAGVGNCGAIVAWTKDGGAADRSPVAVGVTFGLPMRDSSAVGRIGGQLAMPFRGPLDLYLGLTVRTASGGSRWQTWLSLRARPVGRRSPWYVGGGIAVNKDAAGETEGRFLMLTGLTVPRGPIAPFVEVHLHNLTEEAFGFVGVRVRVGG